MAKANEVIARFGGQSALARALGVNQSTVQHWAKTGQIPSWRQEQVQRAAQEQGVVLPGEGFGGRSGAGGATVPRTIAGRLPSSAPPSMSTRVAAGYGGARAAVQGGAAGQLGVPHGRADFTPNVELEIGALRDEIGQLKALVERLVGEVAALRGERDAVGRAPGARRRGQRAPGKSTSRS